MNVEERVKQSLESMGELKYRLFLAEEASMLFYYFGSDKKEQYDNALDETPEYKIRSIVRAYAFIQLSAVFDGKGKYSLSIQNLRSNPALDKSKIHTLFPVLTNTEVDSICQNVNTVLLKHKKL